MNPVYFIATFLLAFQVPGQSLAQVNLPLEASNCAIFNALNPDSSLYCDQATNLGTPRGLIVQMDELANAPVAPKTLAQLPITSDDITIAKHPRVKTKPPAIDYKAAKSESGYYIHFAFDSEKLEKQYRDHLDRLAIVLNSPAMKDNCIKITGHTDTVGSAQYNLALSRRRAQTVYNYLTSSGKINKQRFTIEAAGEARPLPEKAGISPYNRRVEFSSKPSSTTCRS
jgi:outer membrane protein OmpA-like peptidoglycan-associated protein